jgi:hypothetical protein
VGCCAGYFRFESLLARRNFPNDSDQFRVVQYVKMIPVNDPREFRPALQLTKYSEEDWYVGTQERRTQPTCKYRFGETFRPTELGRKLLGLLPWEDFPAEMRIENSCRVPPLPEHESDTREPAPVDTVQTGLTAETI